MSLLSFTTLVLSQNYLSTIETAKGDGKGGQSIFHNSA